MNILLIIWDQDEIRYALLPSVALKGYHYKHWDGQIVGQGAEKVINSKGQAINVHEEIMDAFDRFGLEDGLAQNRQDLKKYLHHKPPYHKIHFVVRIGWIDV